jgi:biopolymer transport protein ExbD
VRRFDQINVIPFIDIMLVLLAIVLTTATFIAQGTIPVTLPEASHSEAPSTESTFEIVIDDAGVIHSDGEEVSKAMLTDMLAGLDGNTNIILRVDSAARFEVFVGIVDLLKGKNLLNVSILTERIQ